MDLHQREKLAFRVQLTSRVRWEEAWQIAIKWGRRNIKTLQESTILQASEVVQTFMTTKIKSPEEPNQESQEIPQNIHTLKPEEDPKTNTKKTPTLGNRRTVIEIDKEQDNSDQPLAKRPKETIKGFSLGATEDSDDEIFFPTVEVYQLESETPPTEPKQAESTNPTPSGSDSKPKPTSSTGKKEPILKKLQTEKRVQSFGIFERQEHRQNKIENWSLKPQKPILILGDSNLTHLPKIPDEKTQVVSYLGAKLEHIYHILKNKTEIAPEVHIVILHFGTNNREVGNTTKLQKILERVRGAAKETFPTATIYFPLINYDSKLPTRCSESR